MSELWRPILRNTGKPRYMEIAEAIRDDVVSGVLAPGDRLPPQRTVAQELGLDFTTVSKGYGEAIKQGLIESFVGRGSFVRQPIQAPEQPDPRRALEEDPMMNMPPDLDDPDLVAEMSEGLANVSANMVSLLRYQSAIGSMQDREFATLWMEQNGFDVHPDRLAITSGAHASVFAILTAISEPGLPVLCEELVYPGLRSIAAQMGLQLIGVPCDENGVLPDALETAIATHFPAALYLNPTLQNPATYTIPQDRRSEIAEVLERYETPLIEDDACCFVAQDAPAPISTLIPDQGWYIAGLSKCLGAGLRLAFTTVPEGLAKGRFAQALRTMNIMPSPLTTALVSRWIEKGTAAKIQTATRQAAAERQALAASILSDCDIRGQAEAFNIWLTLPDGTGRAEVMGRMLNRQIGVMPSDPFTPSGTPSEALRVCLGGPIAMSQLRDDLHALRDAVFCKDWIG